MLLPAQEKRDLHNLLLDLYPNTSALAAILTLLSKNIEDVTTGGSRREKYLEVVDSAARQNWLEDLLEEIFLQAESSDPQNTPTMDQVADLSKRIWSKSQEGDPHLHLLATNLAFVNRDGLRHRIADVVNVGSPSVLIVKGTGLAGTSYCWQLINHVSREVGDIKTIHLNFDTLLGDLTPEAVMRSIALLAGFDSVPSRNDLLGQDGEIDKESAQLAQALTLWFSQQAGNHINDNGTSFWLVLDNAHRDTVPPMTKEMVRGLADLIGSGQVPRLALFVLGADLASSTSFLVHEEIVAGLGRQDITDYLQGLAEDDGTLGDFASVAEAVDAITENCDFANPETTALRSLTMQLTELVRSM